MEEELDLLNNAIAKIKVIGVGGGGNNAVNRMIDANIKSAEFVAVNTDKQALFLSKASKKIQIGEKITGGLGAGAEPRVGAEAADESREALRAELKGVDMLFITAGMGGGTGTGAAPIIASMANEMNILTVAVVTKPFEFEGKRRMKNAEEGISNLRKYVDTLVVIPNEKLLEVLSPDTTMVDAFIHADEVLRKAIQGISDLIVTPSFINLDFADVRSVMKKKGLAHMGIGEGDGSDRMMTAVRQAVMSPLLETNIGGSSGIILNIVGGLSLTLSEVNKACKKVQEAVEDGANIIFGAGIDEKLGDKVQVTLIATGFECKPNVAPVAQNNDPEQHPIMTNEEFASRFDNTVKPTPTAQSTPNTTPYYVPKPINYSTEPLPRTNAPRENYKPMPNSFGNENNYTPSPRTNAPQVEKSDENDESKGGFKRPPFMERLRRR